MIRSFLKFIFSPFDLAIKFFSEKNIMIDNPDDKLKNHKSPTPILGGGFMVFSFIFLILLAPAFLSEALFFLACLVPFLFIGIADDFFKISPLSKFIMQLLATLFFVAHFFPFNIFYPLLVFLTLTLVNGFNLVDVSDGFMGLSVLPVFVFMIALSVISGNSALIFLSLMITISLCIFLRYNKAPAKVYAGEAGSNFLVISALYIFFSLFSSRSIWEIILLSAVFGVFLSEVLVLMIIRRSKGLPFYHGSRHHSVHYLKDKSFSSNQAALFSFFASLCLCIFASLFYFGVLSMVYFIAALMLGYLFWVSFIYTSFFANGFFNFFK